MTKMPELMDGAGFAAVVVMGFAWILKRQDGQRRIPFWMVLALGLIAAYIVPPVLSRAIVTFGDLPGLSRITEGSVLFGLWIALITLSVFETKGQSRRVPVWLGLSIGLFASLVVPPLIDRATGSYQNLSLKANVNGCTGGMLGQVAPREVINHCDYPITVGLCLPGEKNPNPCRQTMTIEPDGRASFDPGEARLSSLPSNLNGLTVVACRPPQRPSRNLSVMGRGYEGVCLPGA